jgi:competence protein ComEA
MDAWLERYRGYLILTLVYTILFGALWLWRQPQPAPIEILDPSPQPTRTPGHLVVHVSGAVMNPDVYTLPENSRLKDALLAAGGARSDAELTALNLAAALYDGQQVWVPAVGEDPPPAAAAPPATQPGAPLNVNTASVAELDMLPGIGPALAQRIIEEREANGPYGSVEELARVRGIGASLVEKLRPLVVTR